MGPVADVDCGDAAQPGGGVGEAGAGPGTHSRRRGRKRLPDAEVSSRIKDDLAGDQGNHDLDATLELKSLKVISQVGL